MKILIYPEGENPYQSLLYDEINKIKDNKSMFFNYTFAGKKNLPFIFPLILFRIKGFSIFHLHWVTPFMSPIPNQIFRLIFTCNFVVFMFIVKLLNFKIIWTVHNIQPHEKIFFNDQYAMKFLSLISDIKIAHSENSILEMKRYGLYMKNTHIVPIGPYTSVYVNNINKSSARKKLKISENDFVYVFLGIIRPYKGIEDLLDSFSQLAKERKNVKLVIAGVIKSSKLSEKVESYKVSLGSQLVLHAKYIKDNDVQNYYNASDVVVCPFKEITTSSSVNLAMSFKKPVICPNIGELRDIPRNAVFHYNPNEKKSLLKTLKHVEAYRNELGNRANAGYDFVESTSWREIASKTSRLYSE